jgi:hypothetical protein
VEGAQVDVEADLRKQVYRILVSSAAIRRFQHGFHHVATCTALPCRALSLRS